MFHDIKSNDDNFFILLEAKKLKHGFFFHIFGLKEVIKVKIKGKNARFAKKLTNSPQLNHDYL